MKLTNTIHIHKFIHPPPNGRMSIGKCKCGSKDRAFNSMDKKYNNVWNKKNTKEHLK